MFILFIILFFVLILSAISKIFVIFYLLLIFWISVFILFLFGFAFTFLLFSRFFYFVLYSFCFNMYILTWSIQLVYYLTILIWGYSIWFYNDLVGDFCVNHFARLGLYYLLGWVICYFFASEHLNSMKVWMYKNQ